MLNSLAGYTLGIPCIECGCDLCQCHLPVTTDNSRQGSEYKHWKRVTQQASDYKYSLKRTAGKSDTNVC